MLTLTNHLLRMMKAHQFVTEEMAKLQIAERIRHKQPDESSYKQPSKLASNHRKVCKLFAYFIYMLYRSFARNIAQQVSYSTFREDMRSNDTDTLDEDTVADYIKALKKLFVIEDLEAWNPNLRSKAAIRTSDTRHFVDPSIATAALGVGPKDLVNNLNSFGLLFESMAVRDLRVYAEALDGKLYHYRDNTGLECDTVLHRRNGSYALIEVKLGGETKIEEGAHNLKALANKIDTTRMPNPAVMMVLTAVGPYAYRRPDNIYVVPIGCLRP